MGFSHPGFLFQKNIAPKQIGNASGVKMQRSDTSIHDKFSINPGFVMGSKPSMVCINSFIDSLKLIIKHQDFHFLNTYGIGFNCSFLFVFCTSANFVIPSIIVSHRHISCVTHNVRLTLFNQNLSCQSKK